MPYWPRSWSDQHVLILAVPVIWKIHITIGVLNSRHIHEIHWILSTMLEFLGIKGDWILVCFWDKDTLSRLMDGPCFADLFAFVGHSVIRNGFLLQMGSLMQNRGLFNSWSLFAFEDFHKWVSFFLQSRIWFFVLIKLVLFISRFNNTRIFLDRIRTLIYLLSVLFYFLN